MKMSQKSAQSILDMFGLDVRSAHRQCLLDHKEWRFATARLAEDEVYVNAVCTYGIASAQWWWGSQGAALHRIILHFFEGDSEVYGLLFVDDWLWLLPVLRYWPGITVILVITMMLGTPVKWSKVTAGVQGTYVRKWVGYHGDYVRSHGRRHRRRQRPLRRQETMYTIWPALNTRASKSCSR